MNDESFSRLARLVRARQENAARLDPSFYFADIGQISNLKITREISEQNTWIFLSRQIA